MLTSLLRFVLSSENVPNKQALIRFEATSQSSKCSHFDARGEFSQQKGATWELEANNINHEIEFDLIHILGQLSSVSLDSDKHLRFRLVFMFSGYIDLPQLSKSYYCIQVRFWIMLEQLSSNVKTGDNV